MTRLRLTALAACFIGLTACTVTVDRLESGTFTYAAVLGDTGLADAPAGPPITLTIDVDAATFTLREDGGDEVSGSYEVLDRDAWRECCYLNGPGHTEIETATLTPASFTVGGITLDGAQLHADGPTLFEAASTTEHRFN